MKSFITSTLLVVTFFVCLTTLFEGANGQEKSCKAVLSDMTKLQMSLMSKCAKGMKFKNAKEKAAKSMCVMKCVLQEVGMLNEQGSTDAETLEKLSKKFFTVETDRLHALKTLTPCMEQHAAGMDDKEELCKSYDPFVKCLMGSMGNFCPPAS